MDPILSIAIPTYNRCKYLTENLSVIVKQIEKYKDCVEILISDNASTDPVEISIQPFLHQAYYSIRYFRQNENIGMNNNFHFIVSKCKGKYILLMGDDDLLSPNFLDIIIPIISCKKEYALIHWNRLNGDEECSANQLYDTNFDGLLQEYNFKDFVFRTKDAPNFMSSILFHKDCWISGLEHVRDSADGYRWFCIVYWGAALLGNPCVYYYMPLVIQRNPSRTYIKKFPYYIIVEMSDLFSDLEEKIPGIRDFWMKHVREHWYWTLPGIADDRPFYKKHEREFLPYLTRQERLWFKIWLYAPFVKNLRRLYRLYKKTIGKR